MASYFWCVCVGLGFFFWFFFWMAVRMRIGEGTWNTFAALQSVMHGFEVGNPVVSNSQRAFGWQHN